MKPNGETWTRTHTWIEAGPDRSIVAECRGNPDRWDLIAAAPEMARALLATIEVDDGGDSLPCWSKTPSVCNADGHDGACGMARDALRKAGVIP
jgi:hypothetical protein